jgi:hypothetical protein
MNHGHELVESADACALPDGLRACAAESVGGMTAISSAASSANADEHEPAASAVHEQQRSFGLLDIKGLNDTQAYNEGLGAGGECMGAGNECAGDGNAIAGAGIAWAGGCAGAQQLDLEPRSSQQRRARHHRSSGQRQQRSACGKAFMQDMHQRNMEDAHNHRRMLDLPPSPPAASLCSTAHDITPRQATQHLWAGSIMGESEAALHASCGDARARPAPAVASDAIAPHTTPDAFAPETHNRSNHTYGPRAAPASCAEPFTQRLLAYDGRPAHTVAPGAAGTGIGATQQTAEHAAVAFGGYEQHALNRVQSGATGGSAAEDHKRALVNTLKNDIHTLQNDMSSRISMLLESLDELLSA